MRQKIDATEAKNDRKGTSRGEYSHISFARAEQAGKAVENLIHAYADKKDAEAEVPLWFAIEELHEYKTVHETHTF